MNIKIGGFFINNENSDSLYIGHEKWKNVYFPRAIFFGWTKFLQKFLWKKHIYWHNCFLNECTPFFECCIKKVKDKDKNILKNIARINAEQ